MSKRLPCCDARADAPIYCPASLTGGTLVRMEITASALGPVTIGHCLETSGAVSVGGDAIVAGAPVYLAGIIETAAGAYVHLKLDDGTCLMLGGDGALRIDGFQLGDVGDEDAAHVSLLHGTLVLVGGRISRGIDALMLQAGAMSLSIRAAKLALCVDEQGAGMVTLLASDTGPDGEVLVHNKIGVEVLTRARQTLRLTGSDGYLATPLTIPSSVVLENYGLRGLDHALVAPTPSEDGSDDFEPFQVLGDRLLERRFVVGDLFPADAPERNDGKNGLLEDAFEGVRYRLPDA